MLELWTPWMQQKTAAAKVEPSRRYERKVTREQFMLLWWVTSHLYAHNPINIVFNIFRYKYNVRDWCIHWSEYPSCTRHYTMVQTEWHSKERVWWHVTYIPRGVTLGGKCVVKYHVHSTWCDFRGQLCNFQGNGQGDFRKKIIIIIFVTFNSAWSRVFRQPNYTAPLFRRPVLT